MHLVGEGVAETAAWNLAKQLSPLAANLCVDAMGQEDEDALRGRHDRENNIKDQLRHRLWDGRLNVTKDPAGSDGDEDRQIDTEFLFAVLLVGLGGAGQSLLDLTTDQIEQDGIGREDDNTGHKERTKGHVGVENIASSRIGTCGRNLPVVLEGSDDNNDDGRKSPSSKVVPLLKKMGLTITLHDHLVKVVRDAERPAEVAQQEIVRQESDNDAKRLIARDPRLVGNVEAGVSYTDTRA